MMNNDLKFHKISVIIPAFNAEENIDACIHSILITDYPKEFVELIVVDNNSSDFTATHIKNYPVKYIYELEKGSYTARNTGAKHAKGDIFAFTDSDCIVDVDWLKEINKTLNNENIDGVMGASFGINNNLWAKITQKNYDKKIRKITDNSHLNRIDTRNFAIKRNTFMAQRGFDPRLLYLGDAEFGFRLFLNGYKIIYNKNIKIFHMNPTNLTKILNSSERQGASAYFILKHCNENFLIRPSNPRFIKFLYIFMLILLKVSKFKFFNQLGNMCETTVDPYQSVLYLFYRYITKIAFSVGYIKALRGIDAE